MKENKPFSVLGVKDRMIKKLREYIENPFRLRSLVYAKYQKRTSVYPGHYSATGAGVSSKLPSPRKHKIHIMHKEHRENCVNVLELLIKRLDFVSMNCLYVNPSSKSWRILYVEEIATACKISIRTVRRVLLSLSKARLIFREIRTNKIRLERKLFKELESNFIFARVRERLLKPKTKPLQTKRDTPATSSHPSHQPFEETTPVQKSSREVASLALKNIRQGLAASLKPPPT